MNHKMFSDTVVRTGREHELDWARAFAVVFMVLIHVLFYLCLYDDSSVLALTIGYLGGPPAAPVFMFLMGVSMVYSRRNTPKQMAKRGIRLLIMAYVLNIVRDVLPYLILSVMGIEWDLTFVDLLLFLDILHLAGMSFLLMALLKKCKASVPAILAVTLTMQIAGDLLANFTDFSQSWIRYVLGLFFYTFEYSAFPVMQWFIYVALGYWFGHLLQRTLDKKRLYTRMFAFGIVYGALVMIGLILAGTDIISMFMEDAYYFNANFIDHAFYLIAVLLILPICYFLSSTVEYRPVVFFVNLLSTKVTEIYVLQWVIVEWTCFAMRIIGVEGFPQMWAIPFSVATLAVSAVCAVWYQKKCNRG